MESVSFNLDLDNNINNDEEEDDIEDRQKEV
jgi:hypothetical protein